MFPDLVSEFVEDCTILEKTRVPDGEGGWKTAWVDGMPFEAAIVLDNTLQARVAESAGMTAVYTVTTERTMPLDFHDVFRRDRDGQTFRVTSDGTDKQTPTPATFEFSQVSAEEWELA